MAKQYGDWQILSSAGEGGQAQAFRVRRKDGQEAILKRIKNPNRTARFERELTALRTLKSAAVPGYLDSGETDGKVWVVTEDCGAPLPSSVEGADLLRRLRWFRDVSTAIRDAHHLGIIHRDIKPDNVVISRNDARAYVIDFGICAISDSPPLTSLEAFGNAAFAAPECSLGHPERSGAPTDVYSCGKLLYWLVSNGQFIFRERIDNLEDSFLPTHPNLGARIFSLLRACVRISPADRIDADVLHQRAHALVQYAESLEATSDAGVLRIVDNFESGDGFNRGGSMEVTSNNFQESELHDSQRVIGGIRGNIACAERYDNRHSQAICICAISVAARSLSSVSAVDVRVLSDCAGVPSTTILGSMHVNVCSQAADVRVIKCAVVVPPGPFWVAFVASGESPTYFGVNLAPDDVVPRRATLAESTDGGNTWKVTSHTSGAGLALRIEAHVQASRLTI